MASYEYEVDTLSHDNNITITNTTDITVYTPASKAILIVVYTVSVLLSVTGNTAAILVFSQGRRSRTELRPFLINLAIADLIMAVFCIPFTFTMTILGDWVFSPPMCPIVLYLQLVSVTVSVSTNTAIGLDRLWAFALPLRKRMSTRNVRYVIAAIWTIALGVSSVQLVVGRERSTPTGHKQCGEVWPDPAIVWKRGYTLFLLFITYVFPLLVLTFTYTVVGRLLWRHQAPGNIDVSRELHQLRAKRKVVKMLVTIVLVFGICWLPLHIFMLILDYHPYILDDMTRSPQHAYTLTAIFCTVHWLAMSNSFANPIIYGFMNESFRYDLKHLAYKLFPLCRTESMRQRYTFMSARGNASSFYMTTIRGSPTTRQYRSSDPQHRLSLHTNHCHNSKTSLDYRHSASKTHSTDTAVPFQNSGRRLELQRAQTLSALSGNKRITRDFDEFTTVISHTDSPCDSSTYIGPSNDKRTADHSHTNGAVTQVRYKNGTSVTLIDHQDGRGSIASMAHQSNSKRRRFKPRFPRSLKVLYNRPSAKSTNGEAVMIHSADGSHTGIDGPDHVTRSSIDSELEMSEIGISSS